MRNNSSTIGGVSLLEWSDWMIISTMLIISIGIGIYFRFTGGRQKTIDEYFFADRSVGILTLSLTMMIVYLSGITLLGTSAENYSYGAQFNIFYLGFIVGTPIVSYFYLPVFYKLNIISIYEYLRQRFGITTKLIASIVTFTMTIFYLGIAIHSPALTLEATIGLDRTTSILLIGFICTFYSSIGGVKAIIITDVIQSILMLIGIYSVIGIALSELNGDILNVYETAQNGGRLNFFNFDFDPTIRHSWWSLLIGGIFFFLCTYGCGQVEVQRMLSTTSIGHARKALWLNIFFILIITTSISFCGLILYTFYVNCDPVSDKKIRSYDMVMPYFVKSHMKNIPGLTGIFITGIFSAILSTISAMLNSLAVIGIEDYIKPIYQRFGYDFTDKKMIFYGNLLSILIGIVSLLIAIFISKLRNIVQIILAINGAFKGPILAIFTLGIFTESANEIGVITGMIVAIIGNLFMVFSPKPHTPRLPLSVNNCPNSTFIYHNRINKTEDLSRYLYINRLSYLWISPISMFTTLIIGYIVSFIVKKLSKSPSSNLNLNLFTPLLAAKIKRRREYENVNHEIIQMHTKVL